jgi:hypothetical protein
MSLDIRGLTPRCQQELFNLDAQFKQEQARARQWILEDKEVIYLDPMCDRTFKWLMGAENIAIAKTIFDSMIFLTYKGLVNREVGSFRGNSSQVDAMIERLKRLPNDFSQFQALNSDIAATLELSGSLDRGIDYKGDGIV